MDKRISIRTKSYIVLGHRFGRKLRTQKFRPENQIWQTQRPAGDGAQRYPTKEEKITGV